MSTHNICFYGEIRKNIGLTTFHLKRHIWSNARRHYGGQRDMAYYMYCEWLKLMYLCTNEPNWGKGGGGWVRQWCSVDLCYRVVQLILACSWARPAVLAAGKERW